MTSGHGIALGLAAGVLAVWLVVMSISLGDAELEPEATGTVLATFPVRANQSDVFAAIIQAGGRPVRRTWLGFAWIADSDDWGFAARLKQNGATGVYRDMPLGPSLGGCAAVVSASRWLKNAGLIN